MKAEIHTRHQTERTILKDVIPIQTPYVLGIMTGDVCNIKCKYCIRALPPPKENSKAEVFNPELMSWELFELIAEQICEFPEQIKTIVFFPPAGEPLMNKNIARMIRKAKETGKVKSAMTCTNALLLTKEKSLELIDSGLDRILISLQGITEIAYKENCGASINMQEFLDNLEFLYDNKKNCSIYMKTLDICLKDGEEKTFYEMFGNICDTIHIDNVIWDYKEFDFSAVVSEEKGQYSNSPQKHDVCSNTFYGLYVNPAGLIAPCDRALIPNYFGNVKDTSLFDAFNGEKRKAFLRMMLQKERRRYPVCGTCTSPDNCIVDKEDDLDPYCEELLLKL
jgi:radical SAM protein with 4Fe4S-binding SPASM domain